MYIILNLNSNVYQLFYIDKMFKMMIRQSSFYQFKFHLRDFL